MRYRFEFLLYRAYARSTTGITNIDSYATPIVDSDGHGPGGLDVRTAAASGPALRVLGLALVGRRLDALLGEDQQPGDQSDRAGDQQDLVPAALVGEQRTHEVRSYGLC